jgi:hypothetical protein
MPEYVVTIAGAEVAVVTASRHARADALASVLAKGRTFSTKRVEPGARCPGCSLLHHGCACWGFS